MYRLQVQQRTSYKSTQVLRPTTDHTHKVRNTASSMLRWEQKFLALSEAIKVLPRNHGHTKQRQIPRELLPSACEWQKVLDLVQVTAHENATQACLVPQQSEVGHWWDPSDQPHIQAHCHVTDISSSTANIQCYCQCQCQSHIYRAHKNDLQCAVKVTLSQDRPPTALRHTFLGVQPAVS